MFWRAVFWTVMSSRGMLWRALGRRSSSLTLFLLIVAVLIVSPVSLHAQSDSAIRTHDFAFPVSPPPHLLSPPTAPSRGSLLSPPGAPRKALPFSPKGIFGLAQLTRAAGRIFSGTVTAISPHMAAGQGIETVSITFHVDRAIRGVVTGQDLTISQWMGAWSSGQRYRTGERLLLFLYPSSKLGLTSCVGGNLGRFTFDSLGRILLSPQHLSAFRTNRILGGKSRASFSDFALAVDLARSQTEAQE
jgi:hypothetical protein